MTTPVRVALFVVGLAAVFGIAFGAGRVVDPDPDPAAQHGAGHEAHPDHGAPRSAVSVHLALERRQFTPGDRTISFQLQDDHGSPVTAYDVQHEKELHLIALDTRELRDFQHVHPTRAADGTWTARLRLSAGTSYRLYADGSTGGQGFVATADIYTTGSNPGPQPLPAPATTARVGGLTVTLHDATGTVRLEVARGGRPVTLEPYLGALGHLVVIRADDLSYLHVHPEEGEAPVFQVAGLAPGRYRYFFDFQVGGVVRTAAFTVDVGSGMPMGSEEHDDDHD